MLTTTKTSVAGYQSSPCVEWGREAPRFYQSRSLQEQAKSRTTEWASEIGSNQCYDHAKAHAFPSVDSASTTQVGASPVSPVSSSSSYSTFPDVNSIHLPTDLNDLKPMTLSPSLQSAAARAPVPISTTTTDISRLAPFKPGVVSSTPLALPGPQELIKSISRNKQGEGGGARSEFGLTTKIVPLPVTTTRPLPLVERNKSYKPPVVTLTAEEYALRPTVTRVSGPGSYVTQHSLRLGAPPPNVLAGGQHLPEHPRMSTSGMPPCTGQLVPMGGITAPVLVSSIPEGYTSVNPGGRSYSEKKLIQCSEKKIQGDFQQSQAAPMIGGSWPTVQRHPLAHLSYIPPGFTSINPPGRSYSEAKRKTTKPQPFARSNDQREGQRRQAAGRNNAVKVGGNERQPAPVVFPFASVGELKTRKGRPPMSKNRNFAEADSPAMRSIQRRETAMESLDMPEPGNDEDYSCDRPAICSFNPSHPLYQERIQKGEITADIVCEKRFTRKSDCVRHERIHVNDRPFACTFEDCNKSFIQRSALTVHIRTHTGEKPHTCDVCMKSFTDSSSLARHRRTHNGIKPYPCSAPHCNEMFARKLSLSRHFHSIHCDLPVPSEFKFVQRTQRQMTPEFTPTAPNRTVNLDAQLDPESELTSVTSSDDSEGGTDTDGNIHLVQDTANEKLVQVYENPTSNGKHMKIYHPRINTRNTANVNVSDHSNLAAVMATGIPAKKRKYEIADFSHAASQYILQPQASEFESVRFGRQGLPLSTSVSDMPANRFRRVRESEERSKLKGTVSATRNEIALPLDTIYGPMTPASANSNPWPSATHPMTLGHSRTNYQPGENVHKPIYLSMQAPPRPTIALKSPATRKSRIQGYQSELSSLVDTSYTSSLTTSKEAWTWENIRSTARAAIPHETRNIKNGRIAATLDGDQQSSIDTTVIDSQRIENTNILSEHARLPFLAANRDMAGQKIRPQHTASLNSANSMAESPSEGMVLDGDESRSVQT